MDLSILLQSYFSQKSRPAKKPGGSAAFLFLHQADAVVIRLGGDEGFVLLEDVVHEGDDGVVALRHGLFEGIVVISRDVPLDIRLAGEDLVAAFFEDVRKEHGRAFARVVDVGLEAHAEHGDLRAGLHVARDAVGRPGGLAGGSWQAR